jgi:hypothetical protein
MAKSQPKRKPKELELEVANFVCNFDGSTALVDRLNEVVLPAFFSDESRKYGDTEYYFEEQSFRYLKEGDPSSIALCCRFIKNTVLRRHQHIVAGKLVSDEKTLPSAPSAIVALLLSNHRLLYIREVPNAPSPAQFGSTFAYFMRNEVSRFRDRILKDRQENGDVDATKKAIAQELPFPTVVVVSVVSSKSLEDFVARFSLLTTFKIEIAPTNNEMDNRKFFGQLRDSKTIVHSAKSVLTHHNSKGLDKEGCIEQAEGAKQGNARIEMKGKDAKGDTLVGDNQSFSVRAKIGSDKANPNSTPEKAFSRYNRLLSEGVIEIGKTLNAVTTKIKAALSSIQDKN